jgi:putative NIF3 family GTP cyclohydrolase 1 type 2
MYTARDVATVFERIAPIDSGLPGDELGFVFGDPETVVRGVACMWNAHAQSIARAADQGLNMIICHEALWMGPQRSPWYDGPSASQIQANHMRRTLLERHGMVAYRSHSNWDALPGDGVPDQAVLALGIPGLEVYAEQRFFRVHELPEATTVRELAAYAARGLGYDGCRVFGDREKSVRRFAFLIGGFGENQYHMPQAAMEMGAEALIIGEMSEFIVIAALEMGVPVIETLHSASESPAIRRQAQMLAERLPDLTVRYIASGALAFGPPDRGS